ncbi:hypothetical protein [Nonomuraea sp. PA05]|nr:hypothetical protein [Nonomuraea sp. PA05]
MTFAQILAADPNTTDADIEDFTSYMSDADADRFWRQVRETRDALRK